jgi:4-alpha-glucanotransferase
MPLKRASGLLLHPTSLSGGHGIGDLGPSAYAFVDALVALQQRYWQVLPLGPTGYGDSPYQSFSAFAGNPLLIDLYQLREAGYLTDEDLADAPANTDRVAYCDVVPFKNRILRAAHARFQAMENALKTNPINCCALTMGRRSSTIWPKTPEKEKTCSRRHWM